MITQERAKNLEAQVQAQAERIAELEAEVRRGRVLSDNYYSLCVERAEQLAKQYAALKLARETLEGMKRWFDAEEDHADTTFEERCCMCNVVQATVPEALAAIDALGDAK